MSNKVFYPIVDKIIAYEGGELSDNEVLELFAELIKNGMAWTLQGCYGRTAEALIKGGYISIKGKILKDIDE
jgi:hypothetical protein